jgi:hypothetical protein
LRRSRDKSNHVTLFDGVAEPCRYLFFVSDELADGVLDATLVFYFDDDAFVRKVHVHPAAVEFVLREDTVALTA